MPDTVVRVGTRASRLALWQTDLVVTQLEAAWPAVRIERVPIRTLGDRVPDVPLPQFGDRGLFTRDIEDGLRQDRIDIAVHSLKDLPTEVPDGLALGAVLTREDARDVLVARDRHTIATLPAGAVVGTSSVRRRAQLLALRPELRTRDIRGNVPTRVDKVARGECDATLLALAGLKRLGLTAPITEVLEPAVMLPAPGQGAVAVQIRSDDRKVAALVWHLNDARTRLATAAERGLLAALHGGCQAPVGAAGTWVSDTELRLDGLVASYDGRVMIRQSGTAAVLAEPDAMALAETVAGLLRSRGADKVLADCRAALIAASGAPIGDLA
jgi:hydroxymethylbilane synthase